MGIEDDVEELLLTPESATRRATVSATEDDLFVLRPVLGNGHVRVVDYMGDDAAIVQAARVSYGKGTKGISSDRGLIRYLLRHKHTSPLEMCEMKFHIKAPIFVARQWLRPRMSSTNEYSARYSILDREFYVPRPEDIHAQATINKQGRGAALSPGDQRRASRKLTAVATASFDVYDELLNDVSSVGHDPQRAGVSREIARTCLPLSAYTQWYWKIDLHNLLHFLRLRLDPHAQYEIRVYAEEIAHVVQRWVPLAWEAFEDYHLHGQTLSRMEWEVVKRFLHIDALRLHLSIGDVKGLSAGEVKELQSKLGK